jgi:diguanylate cyclase (GGDEF)-like protein
MEQNTEQALGKRRNTLILIISFILITGFFVTSFGGYYVFRSELRSNLTKNELPMTSDNIYSEIQRDLMRPIFISSLMAQDTFLRDWVVGGEKNSHQIIRYLKEIKEKYSTFTSFFVSEKTRIYYHARGVLKRVKPEDPKDRWYFRVKSMKDDYEINVDPDMANRDTMTIFINYKVYDYSGSYIGATGVGLTVSAVKKLIGNYQEKYGRDIYFSDKEGNIILHSRKFAHNEKNINKINGLSEHAKQILSMRNSQVEYSSNGVTFFLNSRCIPELNWLLMVEQREAPMKKNITRALIISLLIYIIITGIVLFFTNFTIKKYQSGIEQMATTDKLTGTFNRQAFDMIIEQAIKDVKRRGKPFSLILFDLDHFKKINDTYGHLAGDEVLRSVADITRNNIRENDIISRWGGEEFLVILKECGTDEAAGIAEKIRGGLKKINIVYNGREIPVTMSFGVSEYREGEERETLLSRIDKVLYRAKEMGRDRVEKEIV